jgi:hypothetical protein
MCGYLGLVQSQSQLNPQLNHQPLRPMESPSEMLEDLKEIGSVLGVNFAAIALSLSEIEQTVRIVGGIAAIVYTLAKIYKLLHK